MTTGQSGCLNSGTSRCSSSASGADDAVRRVPATHAGCRFVPALQADFHDWPSHGPVTLRHPGSMLPVSRYRWCHDSASSSRCGVWRAFGRAAKARSK